jgi:hypothetical protein
MKNNDYVGKLAKKQQMFIIYIVASLNKNNYKHENIKVLMIILF